MAFLDNTYKSFYYPEDNDEQSDEEGTLAYKVKNAILKRKNDVEEFFEKPKKKKKVTKKPSTVGRLSNGGTAYISSNNDDGANASHLIKIEIYDLKKTKEIAPTELWKHAELRVKYYTPNENDKNLQGVQDIIYDITKQLATEDCNKYFINN